MKPVLVRPSKYWFPFQNAKNDSITEWKSKIAEKTQKLVRETRTSLVCASLSSSCFHPCLRVIRLR